MSGEILLERDGDIATVTLSNPGKLNALGLGSWKRLGEVMRELDADKRLRCVVMRGAGDKAFAAGADISEFETTRRNAKTAKKYGAVLEATMGAIARCRHPIVAMIHGVCVGGGLEVISQ
ncbi:MAG: enoyl-CoA hydratase/isomerase family protein, partial [Betaproteobacteria bacterium]